jgi:carboxylesterase type B
MSSTLSCRRDADTTAGATGARELAAGMADTWIAFARHGRPDDRRPGVACSHGSRTRDDGIQQRMPHNPRPDRDARLLWTRLVKG